MLSKSKFIGDVYTILFLPVLEWLIWLITSIKEVYIIFIQLFLLLADLEETVPPFFYHFFSNRLKECCERLMFHDPIEYGRKAEELLWRKVFYDVIQTMKQFKKVTNISAHTSLSCYVVCKRYILTII